MPRNREELFYMYPKGTLSHFSDNSWKKPRQADFRRRLHPDFRRHGVGSFLIDTMKDIAHTKYKAQALKLVCHNTNTRAMLFYFKNGFKPFDMNIMEDYERNRIVGIMMSATLGE